LSNCIIPHLLEKWNNLMAQFFTIFLHLQK
jgi:hypothetical protein